MKKNGCLLNQWDGRVPRKEDCMHKIREGKNAWHIKEQGS